MIELYKHWRKQLKTALLPDSSEIKQPLRIDEFLLNRVINAKIDAKLKANG